MKKTIIIAAALAAMTACNKSLIEMTPAQELGTISLGVTADTEMVVTKAGSEFDTYNVTLKQGETVKWTKEYSAIQESDLKVPAGTYTIEVENVTVEEAYATENGVIRVSGKSDVTVSAGVSSDCTVACTPQNSKVSFISDASFNEVFTAASVSVKESASRTVEMEVAQTHSDATAAYFEPATMTWTLTATTKLDSKKRTYSKEFSTTKAKWTQVAFTTGNTDGQITVTITVDGQITETITITEEVDPFTGTVVE